MSFWYQVILKPSDVKFTSNKIPAKFDNSISLQETLSQLKDGTKLVKDLPMVEVVWYVRKWEWYTLNNRRLWVLQELEKLGKITYVAMKRVEYVEGIESFPSILYKTAEVVDIDLDKYRPKDIQIVKCKVRNDCEVKVLSKRFNLLDLKSPRKRFTPETGESDEVFEEPVKIIEIKNDSDNDQQEDSCDTITVKNEVDVLPDDCDPEVAHVEFDSDGDTLKASPHSRDAVKGETRIICRSRSSSVCSSSSSVRRKDDWGRGHAEASQGERDKESNEKRKQSSGTKIGKVLVDKSLDNKHGRSKSRTKEENKERVVLIPSKQTPKEISSRFYFI